MKLDFLVDYLCAFKFSPIFNRVLNFKPSIGSAFTSRPIRPGPGIWFRFELIPELSEVRLDCGISLDVDSSSGENDPGLRPFGLPPINVLTPQIRMDDLRA